MIVIGSVAAQLRDITLRTQITDLDLIGTPSELELFRRQNAERVVHEKVMHDHRFSFKLKPGCDFEKVEFDVEQSVSDQLLDDLCDGSTSILGCTVKIPTVQALYLIKRAHANVPVHYDKTIRDVIRLKKWVGDFTTPERRFYEQRKRECQDRYALHRQRFSLAIKNEDFFALSNHVRIYEHDDLHEAVAHESGAPLYKKCKRDLSKAKIDIDLFEQLTPADRLRMVQEEFMVIGVERFYLHDRTLGCQAAYAKGMHKTIRDLFVGYFQDFCIDNIDHLLRAPDFDFIARFEQAVREGRVREVEITVPAVGEQHKLAWTLIRQGRLEEARRICEDLVRRADFGGDPHAFFLLGLVMRRAGRLAVAEKCFRNCLSRDRKNALCWFHLGALCRVLKKNVEAIKYLHTARTLGLRNFGVFMNLGLACEGEGRPREAMQAYRRALELKPDSAEVQGRLAALGAFVH